MHSRLAPVLCALIACAGCNEQSPSPPAAQSQTSTPSAQPGNDAILGKVYAAHVSVPVGFYRERDLYPGQSYTLRHLRTVDLDSSQTPASELCTDDMVQALTWSDQVMANPTVLITTVEERDGWYEIVRQGQNDLTRHRVFKCAYLNRDGVNPAATAGPAGKLGRLTEPSATLRELSEYLWQFSLYSNPGAAVLASVGATETGGWTHTLELAVLTTGAGQTSGCDLVQRIDWQHHLDPAGILTTSREIQSEFEARLTPSGPQTCGGN